ncbi:hypothetical protein Scep_016783 [Stephania cephalantha]|uniref:Uncharacterized protein n=1 Tax=Stephania cephalantha TaxID=152367 RepID=A0AAP0NV05_9MAGN
MLLLIFLIYATNLLLSSIATTLFSIVFPSRHHPMLHRRPTLCSPPRSACPTLCLLEPLLHRRLVRRRHCCRSESQPPSPSLIDSSASRTLLPCSATAAATMRTSVWAFSNSPPTEQSMESRPQYPSLLHEGPPPPPSSIPSKLIVNFVLPYQFEIASKESFSTV